MTRRGDRLVSNRLSFRVVNAKPVSRFSLLPTADIESDTGLHWTIYVNPEGRVVDLEKGREITPLCSPDAFLQKQAAAH